MFIKRGIYILYYIKTMNWSVLSKFVKYVKERTGKRKFEIYIDMLYSSFMYNISLLEYFQFHFYGISHNERKKWAGTGFMYEYQLKMNPRNKRLILDDKNLFYKSYHSFFIHKLYSLYELKTDVNLIKDILINTSGKIVFKASNGKCGRQVKIRNIQDFSPSTIVPYMEKEGYDLVEEFIIQHPELHRLSPSAVNTVRIITELRSGQVKILGCRLRISVNSPVDNMAAGNLAAEIDEKSGIVSGAAVYSDITKDKVVVHPVTGVKILGFKIPFWEATIKLVKAAALLHSQNKSIGWDVVITNTGPGLIEGNHDWCKLLWQLPVEKGLKHYLM